MATFFRLLGSPISAKGDDLRRQVTAVKRGQPKEGIFQVDPEGFAVVPGTPFAYWAEDTLINLFSSSPILESINFHACSGTNTGDDFRFIRIFWEVEPEQIRCRWYPFPKGGIYSRFYSSIPLLIDWGKSGETIRTSGYIRNPGYYFRPGLTWSARTTSNLSVRCLPSGCVFSHKGLIIIEKTDDRAITLALLSVMNTRAFQKLVEIQLAAATVAARSYEVGVIQNTPIPANLPYAKEELAVKALQTYAIASQPSFSDETTHVFCLPALLRSACATPFARLQSLAKAESQRQAALANIQSQIDSCVAELYGVPELAEGAVAGWAEEETKEDLTVSSDLEEDEEDAEPAAILRPSSLVGDLLMWCIGVAFGRWDVRKALEPSRLPELPGPFDPLPVCSPGMLTGVGGLPMQAEELPADYPLPVAWDGFVVDDPGHPDDIVTAVERTLALAWPDNLEQVEREVCEILNVPDLRAWFRDPKGFFAYHTKRYSKSRRKAPIYWPLQSARRNYTIWLYYPRLNPGSLYQAGREYADAKLSLETGRLEDWQRSLGIASGGTRKLQERKIAAQAALVDELKTFVKALDAAAFLELKPDLNDGVLLNIAPLHEVVPWKEAGRAWDELVQGKYEWSSIGKQLRQRGLVKNTNKVKEAK